MENNSLKIAGASNAKDVIDYFENALIKVKDNKVKAVFSYCPFSFEDEGTMKYICDTLVYVVFDNNKCFVFDYYFIDELTVELRDLTEQEIEECKNLDFVKDFFNNESKVYADNSMESVLSVEKIALQYDVIDSVEVSIITEPYAKWVDDEIKTDVKPDGRSFDKLTFRMKNGKSFSICPDNPESDGYVLVWSDDAVVTTENFDKE
ncbi:MAG: hypothetical protein MJ193_03270 [Clostridia bacterium]|nr:hypothetical protein [Clostridia bacterium]